MQGSRRLAMAISAASALALLAPSTADAVRFGHRTLRRGMHGSDVRTLQRYLTRVGHRAAVDGEFGRRTQRSVRGWERDAHRRVDGIVTPADARALRRRARRATNTTDPQPTERATLTPDGLAVPPASAPPEVQAVIDAGNRIAHKPYKYGGGHGSFHDTGYDCSGSVSYALHGANLVDAPMTSGDFMSYGQRGRGTWITIRANSGHVYMIVAGLRFDTSGLSTRGTRWTRRMRRTRGYRARHPVGF